MAENNERLLSGMTIRDAIFRCGELQLPYDQVIRLIVDLHPINRQQLLANLQTPGTDEYEWYVPIRRCRRKPQAKCQFGR